MKTLSKQMLSLLLAVVFVLQLLPATVFAEQEDDFTPAIEVENLQTDNNSEYTQENWPPLKFSSKRKLCAKKT